MAATPYVAYRRAVLATLSAYRRRHFAGRDVLFEPGPHGEMRFWVEAAHRNLFDPALYHALTRRPTAFRALTNPQVLAISVFGTLARREDLPLLASVPCDDGQPVLASAAEASALALDLQRPVPVAAARTPTVVDVWLSGAPVLPAEHSTLTPALSLEGRGGAPAGVRGPIAVHGRLLERSLGPIARLIPALAASPGARREILLVYDARNPVFAPGRQADRACVALAHRLPPPLTLRRTTWQALAAAMARSAWYADLLGYLQAKYGIEGV